jgi:hypothetical protein
MPLGVCQGRRSVISARRPAHGLLAAGQVTFMKVQ